MECVFKAARNCFSRPVTSEQGTFVVGGSKLEELHLLRIESSRIRAFVTKVGPDSIQVLVAALRFQQLQEFLLLLCC